MQRILPLVKGRKEEGFENRAVLRYDRITMNKVDRVDLVSGRFGVSILEKYLFSFLCHL